MKKAEQQAINEQCIEAYKRFKSTNAMCDMEHVGAERLDCCQAQVLSFGRYTALKSYNTIVAFIDFNTGILYDVLRYVYGYTATSSKHISKFARRYDCTILTYRD